MSVPPTGTKLENKSQFCVASYLGIVKEATHVRSMSSGQSIL